MEDLDDTVATVLVVGLFSVKVAAVSIKLCGQWGASETNDDEGSMEDTTATRNPLTQKLQTLHLPTGTASYCTRI